MGWILATQNSYVEAQALNETVFGDRTFITKIIKIEWGHKGF